MSSVATGARVRNATHADIPAVLTAVAELLTELGSAPPPAPAMLETARALLDDPRAGVLLVAVAATDASGAHAAGQVVDGTVALVGGDVAGGDMAGADKTAGQAEPTVWASGDTAGADGDTAWAEGAVVGVLAASYQTALHVPGRYAVIQDLWVDPAWRSRAVGRELLEALFARARAKGMARAEVGLPRESFANIAATERFYAANGFAPLGPRMRRVFT